MLKNDLFPPKNGMGSDPILYGVAAGLAELFPPVVAHVRPAREEAESEGDPDEDRREGE